MKLLLLLPVALYIAGCAGSLVSQWTQVLWIMHKEGRL